jgi:hypothetical protein
VDHSQGLLVQSIVRLLLLMMMVMMTMMMVVVVVVAAAVVFAMAEVVVLLLLSRDLNRSCSFVTTVAVVGMNCIFTATLSIMTIILLIITFKCTLPSFSSLSRDLITSPLASHLTTRLPSRTCLYP